MHRGSVAEVNGGKQISRSQTWRTDLTLVLLLFITSLSLRRMLLVPTGFDGLYGQDAYAYYDFAGELRTALREGRTPGEFFWPLGYPALLAVGFALFGNQATAGQAISVLLGAALSPLVYVLARQIGLARSGALVAGLVMAVCGQALQSSLVLMSDTPALFWALVSAVLLSVYLKAEGGGETPSETTALRWLALSAVALALASITRWLYLALAIPWVVAVLIRWKGHIRWRASLIAVAGAGTVFMPQILYNQMYPAHTFSHAWVEGWTPAHFFQRKFANIDGHFEYEEANAIFYARPFYDAYYLAPVFIPFWLVGLCRLLWRRDARTVLIAGWALVPYLFLAGIPYQNIRFPLIMFPAAAFLTGAGLETFIGWTKRIQLSQRFDWGKRIRALLALLVVYGVYQTLIAGRSTIGDFIAHQQSDKDAAAWTVENIPPETTLYTFGLTLTLKHYTSLKVHEIYYETPETLASEWIGGQDDYLLVNVWNIEHQWAGREPQTVFHWLRDVRGLIEVGEFSHFTLYRIGG